MTMSLSLILHEPVLISYCLPCAQGRPCGYTNRQRAKFLAGHRDFWCDHVVVVVQCTQLHSSLCTLSLGSWGLKERPYQCPPGPTPPLEPVSSGVKAGGKVKPGRRGRTETKKCNEGEIGKEKKKEQRETRCWERKRKNPNRNRARKTVLIEGAR